MNKTTYSPELGRAILSAVANGFSLRRLHFEALFPEPRQVARWASYEKEFGCLLEGARSVKRLDQRARRSAFVRAIEVVSSFLDETAPRAHVGLEALYEAAGDKARDDEAKAESFLSYLLLSEALPED